MIDLLKEHYIKKEITDFYENKVLKKGSIIKVLKYDSNNSIFEVKTINQNTFFIDEKFLNRLYLIEVKEDNH